MVLRASQKQNLKSPATVQIERPACNLASNDVLYLFAAWSGCTNSRKSEANLERLHPFILYLHLLLSSSTPPLYQPATCQVIVGPPQQAPTRPLAFYDGVVHPEPVVGRYTPLCQCRPWRSPRLVGVRSNAIELIFERHVGF